MKIKITHFGGREEIIEGEYNNKDSWRQYMGPTVLSIRPQWGDGEEYMQALASHDWYYQMADDYGAYNRGAASWARICELAKTHDPDHRILNNWCNNIGRAA